MEITKTYIGKLGTRKGKEFNVILDKEGEKLYNKYVWYVSSLGGAEYIIRKDKSNNNKTILFHRELLSCPEDKEIDHINRNTLDNRKSNLRCVTHSQNLMNTGMRKDNKSGHRGVSWFERDSKWEVKIQLDGKRKRIGYFTDFVLACDAYDKKAQELFGEYLGEVSNA
jgi:hypothetical protein